ncbi:MAG TPA: CehA/McbA family metallohydrolase [Candidatus Eisenbergiella merdavium]|uniref:CehA/McbA family metallohydrolase n=1 Tax=Candidatus Eisenbergiella merdavium TaxID=2838551 RepID=A0A9D2NI94_9FIRM|nr:CehA/McbA family metallohydrolase [Candidatus Eisenbergiella merdavium]
MLKRIELHNHSLESDGCMSVEALASWLISNRITAFSLTDHNTVSGFPLLHKYWKENPMFEYLTGFELTSWYGHILCQNVKEYLPWDDLDAENGDLFLDRVHAQGGLVGIAHPKSFPHPVSNGLRFEYAVHDWTRVDFIEIINNSHPAFPDNAESIRYWEDRLLHGFSDGISIAPVSGMDLHAPVDMSRYYRTWLELDDHDLREAPLSEQLETAIKKNRTIVSNGPVLLYKRDGDFLSLQVDLTADERVSGLPADTPFLLSLRSPSAFFLRRLQGSAVLSLSACGIKREEPVVLRLYPEQNSLSTRKLLPPKDILPSCIRASLPG